MVRRPLQLLWGLTALMAAAAPARAAETPASGPAPSSDAPPSPERERERTDRRVVVWPTLTPAGDEPSQQPLHRPGTGEGAVHVRAQELDATLRDGVQDLGYTLDVADGGPAPDRARDLDLVERASRSGAHGSPEDAGTWVVSARIEPLGGDSFLLRIVAVPPRGRQLRVRVERVTGADVPVRGLVLLRDLLASVPAATEPGPRPQESSSSGILTPLRSQGRAVLAANAALFGAFVAYSVQRASGSEDPRLLYPLLALGTGVGLGSALLVADEFDIATGDAWTLAGGAWWGAGAGILIANGRHVQPLTDRYAWGVGGGLIGLGLATFSLTRAKADEGDATLVHSGAAIGLSLGALGDLFYHGDLERTPYTGAGYGAAIGLLGAGTLATFVRVSPSRVLLVDLAAGLGAAAGAAVGSPLVFEDATPEKTRGFLAATAVGTVLGGAVGLWLTRERNTASPQSPKLPARALGARVLPYGGLLGSVARARSEPGLDAAPAYGMGLRGVF